MRTDDNGRMYDHRYHNQQLAGVLRSWPSNGSADQMKNASTSIVEALNSVEIENGCFALSDIDTALKINEWRQIIEHSRIPVTAWCVRSTYDPEGGFNPGGTVVWAAFLTKQQAKQWLPYYKKRFAHRIETGDVFEVVECPAPLNRVYTENADPDDEDWNPK